MVSCCLRLILLVYVRCSGLSVPTHGVLHPLWLLYSLIGWDGFWWLFKWTAKYLHPRYPWRFNMMNDRVLEVEEDTPQTAVSSIRTGSAGLSSKNGQPQLLHWSVCVSASTQCIDCEQTGWDMSFLCTTAMKELLSSISKKSKTGLLYLSAWGVWCH